MTSLEFWKKRIVDVGKQFGSIFSFFFMCESFAAIGKCRCRKKHYSKEKKTCRSKVMPLYHVVDCRGKQKGKKKYGIYTYFFLYFSLPFPPAFDFYSPPYFPCPLLFSPTFPSYIPQILRSYFLLSPTFLLLFPCISPCFSCNFLLHFPKPPTFALLYLLLFYPTPPPTFYSYFCAPIFVLTEPTPYFSKKIFSWKIFAHPKIYLTFLIKKSMCEGGHQIRAECFFKFYCKNNVKSLPKIYLTFLIKKSMCEAPPPTKSGQKFFFNLVYFAYQKNRNILYDVICKKN